MSRMKKAAVIIALKEAGVEFDENTKYNDLCRLLKSQQTDDILEPSAIPNQIKIANKIKKRNTFQPDAVRNERDADFLNAEIGKREHKGKIKRITTVKEIDVDSDGYWITTFTIDLKE